jgi:hypothetical protein
MNANTLVTAPEPAVARADLGVGVGVRVAAWLCAGWALDDAATGDVVLAVEHADVPRTRIKANAPTRWDMTRDYRGQRDDLWPWPRSFGTEDPGCGNFAICLRNEACGSQLDGMDYYSDNYPETPLEEFLAVYERLTKYAKREIHDLAVSLAAGGCVAEESSPIQPA